MRLSDQQGAALRYLQPSALDDAGALVYFGPQRKRVLLALERRGLVRFCPYGGEQRQGIWKITRAGRDWLEDEAARVIANEHRARTDAAVESWRQS